MMMMIVLSLWSSSTLCEDRTEIVCFSPTYFLGRACSRVALKSTLETFLPGSLSLHLMCGCSLAALPSLLLSFSSFKSQTSCKHLSSSMSSPSLFFFLQTASTLSSASPVLQAAHSVPLVSAFTSCLYPCFQALSLQNVSVSSHMHLYHPHCREYTSSALLRVKSLNVFGSPETVPFFTFCLFQFAPK